MKVVSEVVWGAVCRQMKADRASGALLQLFGSAAAVAATASALWPTKGSLEVRDRLLFLSLSPATSLRRFIHQDLT